ncbi:MAG: ATP-binding protein [Blautia sp.]|nr:ATP-binding protein [Blautia sp.]
MYNCRLHIVLAGHPCRAFEVIREMSPLEHFTHEFSESNDFKTALAARADVMIAHLSDPDMEEALQILTSDNGGETQIILLADSGQMRILTGDPAFAGCVAIQDVWISPMPDEEIRFRFSRWQRTYKMSRDYWQTSQYLEATIDHIPNLVWYKDKNGIHEKVNDSFCRAVNKTKQQVEGRGHAYIWDVEQDDPACIESEREVMDKKQTCVSEEIIKAGDGMRTLTTYKSPLYDLDGSVMGTVGVAIDVTQERAYEEEIIQKNQTLETIFTNIDCGVICHTLDGSRILNINRAALKILGYETQEELLDDGFDLVSATTMKEDRDKLLERIRTLKNEGDSVSVEYRVQHKDGEILHIMANIKLIRENGELLYQRFLLDCTAQKLQERKNARQQMELVQALSMDFNLVCFLDPDTGMVTPIRSDKSGAFSIFSEKIPLRESMEQYIREYVYEDDREMLRQAVSLETLKEELAKKEQYYVNYRKYSDDSLVYFQMKAVGAGTGEGSLGIVLGFRSMDDEIRREMEQNSLLEAALSQANKASKAKSVFLSNMSHDIRTPMNAIVGFTNLAITHIDQKEQVVEYLKKIMTSGNHLLNLINDVLDMSHIESGKIHLEEKPCSLPDILSGLRNILQADVNAKQLDLQIDTVNVTDENIYCDQLRLNQVLLNLLSNAVKYTGAGGSINMRVTETSGTSTGYAGYEFRIRDNGIGMSREFVNHIFEPFEREQNSTISKIQGTGLGMAITKNIVDMMGGSIEVKSEQGAGTEFTVSFTFRLVSGPEDSQAAPGSENDPQAASQPDDLDHAVNAMKHHTGRILLVEDVELNQEIAVAILEDAGFATEVAGNGKEAVDMVSQSDPGYYQVVLMDVQMPVMDGYEATREIRSLEDHELASIPIIAMTANAFEEDRQDALRCGMNGHIAKPIDLRTLFETLDSVL